MLHPVITAAMQQAITLVEVDTEWCRHKWRHSGLNNNCCYVLHILW